MNNKLLCHKLLSPSKIAFKKLNALPIVFGGKTKWCFSTTSERKNSELLRRCLSGISDESLLASLAPQQFRSCASDQALCSIRLILSNVMKGGKDITESIGLSWIKLSPIQKMSVSVSWWSFCILCCLKMHYSNPDSSRVLS